MDNTPNTDVPAPEAGGTQRQGTDIRSMGRSPLISVGRTRSKKPIVMGSLALLVIVLTIFLFPWGIFGKKSESGGGGTLTPPADSGQNVSNKPGVAEFVFTPAPPEQRVIASGQFRTPPKAPTAWGKGDFGIIFMEPYLFEGECSADEAKAKIIASAKSNGVAEKCLAGQGHRIEDYQPYLWGWSSDDGLTHKKAYVLRSPRVERIVYGSEFKNSPEAVLASPEGKRLR